MTRGREFIRAAALCSALALGSLTSSLVAQDDRVYVGPRLIEEKVKILADGGRYTIAATVLRPEGPGPFGAVVLNHGVSASARESPWQEQVRKGATPPPLRN